MTNRSAEVVVLLPLKHGGAVCHPGQRMSLDDIPVARALDNAGVVRIESEYDASVKTPEPEPVVVEDAPKPSRKRKAAEDEE